MTKLSFTAISKYLSCSQEYNLYYNERIRPEQIGSPLYFGKAIDTSLNHLILNKDLDKAKELFNAIFVEDTNIVYSDFDVDAELLTQEEYENNAPYYSMKKMGLVMLDSYYKEVIPKIKNVIEVQKTIVIKSDDGDELKILPDLICTWEDGSVILFDNKTSSIYYDNDSAEKSIQLSIYYKFLKEKYNLEKLGFIVMSKNLKKNRIKLCSDCDFDGTGGRHATCPSKRLGARCGGEWITTIRPEAYIQIIINEPNQIFIDNILDTIDKVNYSIKDNLFYKNLTACKRGKRYCDYYKLCHSNSMEGLVKK